MAPGVFISELLTDQFSDYLQTTITSYLYSLADSATARP
jgi:hypothetical protein